MLRYFKIAFTCVFTALLLVAFQNCSDPKIQFSSNEKPSNSGGTGIDGKPYLSYGPCSSGEIGVTEKVVIETSTNSAYLVRQSCTDLPTPIFIDSSRLQFAAQDNSVFKIDSKVFDLQTSAASQKATLSFCHYTGASLSVDTMIWEKTASLVSRLFGSVTESGGLSSGVLNVESLSSGQYSSVAGQSSQFSLQLIGPASGSMTYSINSNPQNSISMIECASQASPPVVDGSASAPSGTAQKSTLLAGYGARPRWKVAGVDYAVGPQSSPTKNPASIVMAGVTVNTSTQTVTVSGNDVTLDGFDFSMSGGYWIVVTGNNVTIKNSKFFHASGGAGIYTIDGRGANLTVAYCVLDAATDPSFVSLIGFSGRGITLNYNWFKNSARVLQMRQTTNVSSALSMKYNLLESGTAVGFNYIEMGSGIYPNLSVEFNTSVETTQTSQAHGYDFDLAGARIDGPVFANNTIIASGTASMDYPINGGTSAVTNGVARDNFFDISGAIGAYRPGTMNGWLTTTAVNMTSGQPF